jgi:6-pyruvoyltetrahydropterin/6-carboxytetrahydropterin synthase
MFDLKVKTNFCAAHRLNGYDGDCSNVHGHNFGVIVVVKIKQLNTIGFGMDFKVLKKEIEYYLKQLDHKNLNDLDPFKQNNPTAEHIAIWIYDSLAKKINSDNVEVANVTVEESEKYSATYYGQ